MYHPLTSTSVLHRAALCGTLSLALLTSACGVGTPNPQRTVDKRNLSYQLTLNDTGVTKYINGTIAPADISNFSTTTYWTYATDYLVVPVALDANINTGQTITYDSSNLSYYLNPASNVPTLANNMQIYDYAGNPISYSLRFTKTTATNWSFVFNVNASALAGLAISNTTGTPSTTQSLTFEAVSTNKPSGDLLTDARFIYNTNINIGNTGLKQKISVSLVSSKQYFSGKPTGNVIASQTGCAWNTACGWQVSANYPIGEARMTPPNTVISSVANYPGQDAGFGLDKIASGNGFKFEKLALDGSANPINANAWGCVRDNVTGLIWEHKTNSKSSRRNASYNYSWFNPDSASNGGMAGYQAPDDAILVEGSTLCQLAHCNTKEYIDYLNSQKLCGRTDWRLPTAMELLSIIDFGKPYAAARQPSDYDKYVSTLDEVASVDAVNFFPNLAPDDHWTSQTEPHDFEKDSTTSKITVPGTRAYALHLNIIMTSHPKYKGNHILAVSGKPMQ